VVPSLADCGKFLAVAAAFTSLAGGWTLRASGSAPFLGISFVPYFCDLAETFTMVKKLYDDNATAKGMFTLNNHRC